jgi:hypothetical protein
MLGRQQVEGAATAISELFKNSHDAYATRVEVDYYRPDNLFLLRDDGIGMTLDEFQERWLTLGTESKVGGGDLPYRPRGMEERPIMGEKGIGRLAIARIGRQVLVMTRARRKDTLHDLVVALVNWELFELPGVNLDEIEIPVEIYRDGSLPNAAQVGKLAAQLRKTVRGLAGRATPRRLEQIDAGIAAFVADPQRIDAFFNSGDAIEPGERSLSLRGDGTGTHFLIQPADGFLGDEIDRDRDSDGDPTFTKFLVGFANTMVPGAPPPRVCTRFRDWRFPETATEIISGGAFPTPEDFGNADHHFSGRFDEFGQFEGTVKIYDEPPVRHVIPWEAGQGTPTLCGPFTVNIAYLQGAARESRVPPEEFAVLKRKLDRFGGIYVYRDGIRVLPYGNSDYDWLNIETRRNKSSGYYFFAYRRVFGAVEMTHQDNAALVEKAGREGFQTNKAYRQLTSILENFLVQLAADFFRETGAKAAVFSERRKELERKELARRKREESVSGRRRAFAADLESFFKRAEEDEPKQELAELFTDVRQALNAAKSEKNSDRAAGLLIEAESFAEHRLAELRKRHTVARPRDIGFGSALRRDWEGYVAERERLEVEVFSPADQELHDTIGAAAEAARVQVDQRRRLQSLIGELAVRVEKTISERAGEAQRVAEERQVEVRELARKAITEVKDAINSVRAELQRIDLAGLGRRKVDQLRAQLERKIDLAATSHRQALENALQQLMEVNIGSDQSDEVVISSGEITGAIEEEVIALREAADADAELVQLGMALAVVTHEFDAVLRSIRNELRRLKGWAQASPQLRPIYERIHANFEHLDGYLALFTPLQRRLYRKPQRITGTEIAKFLEELFEERLGRHKITLTATPAFRSRVVVGYPSTFFPVFVNLIDNAIYWLKDHKPPRLITLTADTDGFLVGNNGPCIPARDREAIFDLRFTRKPGGRGMGLYISRQTLAKAGYRLTLEQVSDFAVCFKIAEQSESEGQIKDES